MPDQKSPPKRNVKVTPVKQAMADLKKAINETATQMVSGRIGWYGQAAVASALAQYLADNLMDNFHDGPDFYEEIVEDILSTPATPNK
jgi:hypothetical protein